MKNVEFLEISNDDKKVLLDVLGFDVEKDGIIIDKVTNKPHICPLSKTQVKLVDASILPGSTMVINTNALTLSEYMSRKID